MCVGGVGVGVVYVDVWILCVNCEALDYQSDLIGSLENLFSPFAHNPGQVRWPRVAYKILTFGIYTHGKLWDNF